MPFLKIMPQVIAISGFIFIFSLMPESLRAETAAESLLQSTYIINIQENMRFSQTITQLGLGALELSQGEVRRFEPWFKPKWTDLRLDFMTQVNDRFGLLWSVSTGERGQKYRVDPEFRAGLIVQFEPVPQRFLSFLYTRSLGGALRELPCVADYGEIGGEQKVNCRLAGSALAPDETLKYLVKIKPRDRHWYGLRVRFQFP